MADFTVGDYDYTIISGTNVSMKAHDTSKSSYADPTCTVTYSNTVYTVTDMSFCFRDCFYLTDAPDLSSMTTVENMGNCFARCRRLQSPPNLSNMSAVTVMRYCFQGCEALTSPPDLSAMTAVTDMYGCFYGCESLTTAPDLSAMTAVTDMGYCFCECSAMIAPPNMSTMVAVSNMGSCFHKCTDIRGFLVIGTSTSPSNLGTNIFGNTAHSEKLYLVVPSAQRSNWTSYSKPANVELIQASRTQATIAIGDYDYMYSTDSNGQLTYLSPTVKNTDKSSYEPISPCVTSLSYCFMTCNNLVSVPDLSSMVSVTEMKGCFYKCTSLTSPPDLSKMTAVTDLTSCFEYCSGLTSPPDLSNMTAVTKMSSCFNECTSLTSPPDLSNMTAVTNMQFCFADCTSLATPPDLSNMSSVIHMGACFQGCTSLASPPDLSSFANVTNMSSCFKGCTSLTSPPDMSSMVAVTSISRCFQDCTSLASPPDLSSSVAITEIGYAFYNCASMSGNLDVGFAPSASYKYLESFYGTSNDIYIIPHNLSSTAIATWRTIASDYQNVHYLTDDSLLALNSIDAERVASSGSTTADVSGSWAHVTVKYRTGGKIPSGYTQTATKALKDSGTTLAVQWTESTSDGVTTAECWHNVGVVQANYSIDLSDNFGNAATLTKILAKAYALLDFRAGGEGVAIGKFSTRDGFDVDMDAYFGNPVYMSNTLVMNPNNYIETKRDQYSGAANPSGSLWMDSVVGTDSAGAVRFNLRQVAHSDGYQGVQLEAHRVVNSTDYWNGLRMEIDGSGNSRVVLGDPTGWLNAIGAAPSSHSHAYLPTSGGTMTGGIYCGTSGANLQWGNFTVYGGGSNGGLNSVLVGDDVYLGDCNSGGTMGMKAVSGSQVGFNFYDSNGSFIGGLRSDNGGGRWIDSGGSWHAFSYNGHGHNIVNDAKSCTTGAVNVAANSTASASKSRGIDSGYKLTGTTQLSTSANASCGVMAYVDSSVRIRNFTSSAKNGVTVTESFHEIRTATG